jgi:hypothetical protein
MAHLVYKDHTIVYSSRPSEPAGDRTGFLPMAVIVWNDPATGVPVIHTTGFGGSYDSAVEAEAVAFNESLHWVDQRQRERGR